MRRLAACMLALACLACGRAQAKVYYINAGVRYHIGNGRWTSSKDARFVGTYPLVGQQWIEGFYMDRRDKVKVDIRRLWGVDDCAYCKDLVWLDDNLIGRLDAADDSTGFATPAPLEVVLDAGQHRVMIESVGLDNSDDFVMEGVSVESTHDDIVLMQPGPILKSPMEPMPRLYLPEPTPVAAGPCDGLARMRDWMPGYAGGQPRVLSLASSGDPATSAALFDLAPGTYCPIQVDLSGASGTGQLGQALKILVGEGDGWDFQFEGGRMETHGNMLRDGDYTAESFPSPDWNAGWNSIELRRCRDGRVSVSVNGRDLDFSVGAGGGTAAIRLQSLGLDLKVRPAP